MMKLYQQYKEIINYLIFGVLTTLVNVVVYFICKDILHIHYLISNFFAWFFSVLFAYITNRKFVFESTSKNIFSEMIKFFSSRIATGVLDMILMWVFVSLLSINGLVSKVVVNVVVIVSNYVLSKLFVFEKR
ncbi:MAG: GtrA family protein [Firmicutes bacterium]|nr:GtrA family protein [Bacillota bacterium]